MGSSRSRAQLHSVANLGSVNLAEQNEREGDIEGEGGREEGKQAGWGLILSPPTGPGRHPCISSISW